MKGLISLVMPTYNVARYLPDSCRRSNGRRCRSSSSTSCSSMTGRPTSPARCSRSGRPVWRRTPRSSPSPMAVCARRAMQASRRSPATGSTSAIPTTGCRRTTSKRCSASSPRTRPDRCHLVACNLHILDDITGIVRDEPSPPLQVRPRATRSSSSIGTPSTSTSRRPRRSTVAT